MTGLNPVGHTQGSGAKRPRFLADAASFFPERSWVTCWIVSEQYALCLTMARKGFRRSASVTLLDAGGGTRQRTWRRIGAGGGRLSLSSSCVRGGHSAVTIRREGKALRVFGCAERWAEDQSLLFDLRLTGRLDGGAEMPASFPGRARWFGPLWAEGRAEIGGEEYLFAPAHSLGLLAEGTGVWRGCPPENRVMAAGWIDGSPAALLLDETAQENLVMMAGRTLKLGAVAWNGSEPSSPGQAGAAAAQPASGAHRQFIGADGRVALTFHPLAEHSRTRRRLFRRGAEETLEFGHFSGQIRLENGRTLLLRRLSGAVLRRAAGGQ